MKFQTVGEKFDTGRIAPIHCVPADTLQDLPIQGNCFLLLILRLGSVSFQVGSTVFEAFAPCFICFDERRQPQLLRQNGAVCDAIYFHPAFLNVNMTFSRVHSDEYAQLAQAHDLFLLRPFTDPCQFVFPLFNESAQRAGSLFCALQDELQSQRDWYWSCRSRSYFMELILLLERTYGIIGQTAAFAPTDAVQNTGLQQAIIYIEGHYSQPLTLAHLTSAASLNHASLSVLFKKELGKTPMEYVWHYRVQVAKKHLAFTSLPVKDIAARCGFQTVQHFSRKFEAATGQTPTAFREQAVASRKAAF